MCKKNRRYFKNAVGFQTVKKSKFVIAMSQPLGSFVANGCNFGMTQLSALYLTDGKPGAGSACAGFGVMLFRDDAAAAPEVRLIVAAPKGVDDDAAGRVGGVDEAALA